MFPVVHGSLQFLNFDVMAKTTIKTGERKTTVTREAVRAAISKSVKQEKSSSSPKAAPASKSTSGKGK